MFHTDPEAKGTTGTNRGSLRVYLGAAPGVGKTYAMLREGHRLKADGQDVVVGLVETHGRAETARQIGDLEIIPRQVVTHRRVAIEDMDVNAILRRQPQVVLVDELAHTNPPGSARPKRYLDVDEIRRHGIDVISTVNVQHLESMTAIVADITGIGVRETIPDDVLDGADEVHLVDLPVSALLGRMEAGKIYPGDRADRALTAFFREGNLTALRELALRWTAEGVDERLSDLMLTHGDGLVAASDRVLVLVDADERWGSVLRSAWRIASALRGDVLAVAMAPQGELASLDRDARSAIERNLRLAEDLGAEAHVIDDGTGSRADRVDALARLVREERASLLVLGLPRRQSHRLLRRPATQPLQLAQAMLERIEGLDVQLVGYETRA